MTTPPAHAESLTCTVIGADIPAQAMAEIEDISTALGAEIETRRQLARQPVTAIEFTTTGCELNQLQQALAGVADSHHVDVAVQPTLPRGAKRLVMMDVDSTLINGEVIEMLAAHAGPIAQAHVVEITEAAMRGELDFAQSLRRRVAQLAGLPASVLDEVYREVELNPGASTLVKTLHALGYPCGLVSGGFVQVTDRIAADLGIGFVRSNLLEVVDATLTGRVLGDIVDRQAKAAGLQEYAASTGVPLNQTVGVGDGANDLDMLATAGLGVAYNAKPLVQRSADTRLSVPNLDAVLFLLGLTQEEIETAVSADDTVNQ